MYVIPTHKSRKGGLIYITYYIWGASTNLLNLEGRKKGGDALDDDLNTDLGSQNLYDDRSFPKLVEI
jgi:hypothetical protein